ncbi:unnamed protein product [Candida verbasci]|uniref:Uncharacterized protein n=1 Tax=Candida verbasci TaxID=1227364 RepID=A0A9W4TQD5_9ASCO|nr:unnamed protein product [Candida verbasci]
MSAATTEEFQQQPFQPQFQASRQAPIHQQRIKEQQSTTTTTTPGNQFQKQPIQPPPQFNQRQQQPVQRQVSNTPPQSQSKTTSSKSSAKDSEDNGPTNEIDSSKKKKRLVRAPPTANPLKYKAWLLGHCFTLIFGTISFIFQIFWLPNKWYINSICYRLSLLGSITALTATFSHKFGLHWLPPIATLMSHQNFQYLVLAIIWCFSFKSIFKIIPYYILSLLHLSQMKKIDIIMKHTSFLASIIAYDELFLIIYLILRTLFFRNASGYQLTIFLIFYWLRILYNKETGNLFAALIERLDDKTKSIKNARFQHYWSKTKGFIKEKQAEEHQDN